MANSKSAAKRILVNKRNQLKNKYYKTSVKTLIKLFFINLENYKNSPNENDKKNLKEILKSIYKFMDKGTNKKVFHKNTIARKKARLVAYFKLV